MMNRDSAMPVPMQWMIFGVATLFVVLGTTVDKLAGISFYLLLLLAVGLLAAGGQRIRASFTQSFARLWPVYLALSGMTICVVLSQILVNNGSWKDLNFALRFQGFFLICWMFSTLSARFFRYLGWAFMLGALVGTINTYWMTNGGQVRTYVYFMPILAYTELTAILGVLAVYSIKWDDTLSPPLRRLAIALKLLAGLGGLYSIYMYQSRGAWLAIPVFVVAGSILFLRGKKLLGKISIALLIMIVIAAVYGSTESVRERLMLARSDVVAFESKANVNTPLGTRFQLWEGSLALYRQNPLIGVGLNGYSHSLQRLAEQGVITPDSATLPHSHNEFLFFAVLFGSCGVLTLLAMYFVPLGWSLYLVRGQRAEARAAAVMVVTFCLAFLMDGLADVMFHWRECGLFFTIVLALLMASLLRWQEPSR